MVKSFLNSLFGGLGRTFGRIIAYIIIALIFFFIYENAHAAAIYGQSGCNSTYYNITKQDGTYSYGQTSTSYNIAWETIGFYGTENLDANTFYDVKIVFRSNFTIVALNEGPEVYSTSSLCGSVNGQLQVSGFGVSGSTLSFRILTNTSMVDYWRIWLPFHFNGSNGINSVTFTKVDISGSSGIIENNNNNTNIIINNNDENTQDIIDNQNQNTQDILDSQQDINDSLNTNCKNGPLVINQEDFTDIPQSYLTSTGSIFSNSGYSVSKYFIIQPSTQYNLYFSSTSNNVNFCWYRSDKVLINCQSYSSQNITFTTPSNALYFRFSLGGGRNISITGPVCNNWNSEVITDLNDSINDTSDVDTNIFSTWLNNYNPIDNPLGAVITLPISLAEKIVGYTDDSCSTINLGSLLGTSLLLRCFSLSSVLPENASSLISTIDTIMSISLLVVIIKNSYETIANIISLGGENKVKSHFRLPTPLEFMSSLLNGNGYSEYVDYR